MIKETDKEQIVALMEREAQVLGGWSALAAKLGVSPATVSANLRKRENWYLVSQTRWSQIAKVLGYKFERNRWVMVETENLRIMRNALRIAQERSMWVAVSAKAGSGKTASIRKYKEEDDTHAVYILQCEEWGRVSFLGHLAQCVGVDYDRERHVKTEVLSNKVINIFKQKAMSAQPLLVLDEADKLRPSALRWLIHLQNKLEGELGCVICGAENLKKEIEGGAKKALKGYDEIDSRFGRNWVGLSGCTYQDCVKIAKANGMDDEATIKAVWQACKPTEVARAGKYEWVVEDMRVLKRKIVATVAMDSLN